MKHVLMGTIFGLTLAVCGFPFTTWQYWLLLLLATLWAVVASNN